MRNKWILLLAAVPLLAGCGEEYKDSPRGTEDTGPADVLLFPDGFSNVARKCDGPNMVYSSTNSGGTKDSPSTRASIAVVPNDPRCKTGLR
jgi:hypothetical protein